MLVDYMASNTRFANREYDGPLGAQRYEAQWEALAQALREHGPDKSVQAWKVTWRDLSRKARSNNAAANRARAQTGNAVEIPMVSQEEQLILTAIGKDTSEGVGPEESRIEDDILNQLKILNETQQKKLELLKESNVMLANSNLLEETENIENLEDTEIMEEGDD
ncbi:uncharacterized protein LOC134671462 [Cydia fagiglandana]|uniref:uncharacterized protein LOC134671462 n=1 Tax=Cydia fagiglandana TaxID=1458189 RepID=UPI002FEE56C8